MKTYIILDEGNQAVSENPSRSTEIQNFPIDTINPSKKIFNCSNCIKICTVVP